MSGIVRRTAATGRLLTLALSASLLGACATTHTTGERTAFVGATVIPMTGSERILTDQTVLVEGDRIVAVGPRRSIAIPAGAVTIDAAGRYLLPSLADMHVHLEYIDDPAILELFVVHGVSTVRNMDGRPYVLDWKQKVEEGTLIGPRILTAGPLLDGDPPILEDNRVVKDAVEARAAVLQQKREGYDFIKVYTNLSRDAYQEILRVAGEEGLPVAGHIPRGISVEEVISGRQASIEHVISLGRWIEAADSPYAERWHWSKLHLAMPVSAERLAGVARRLAESDVAVVPTLVQSARALAQPDTVEEWLLEEPMRVISDAGREFWTENVSRSAQRMDADDWETVESGKSNRSAAVRALEEAGVTLLVGTDTPGPFVVPGASVHEEMARLVAAGISEYKALEAATSAAAHFLGEDDEWGAVAPGARADLLLLERDPLAHIDNTREIAGVMLRGRWLPREELERRLERISIP